LNGWLIGNCHFEASNIRQKKKDSGVPLVIAGTGRFKEILDTKTARRVSVPFVLTLETGQSQEEVIMEMHQHDFKTVSLHNF